MSARKTLLLAGLVLTGLSGANEKSAAYSPESQVFDADQTLNSLRGNLGYRKSFYRGSGRREILAAQPSPPEYFIV
ncbi:MAG: hypothetical protein F6K19_23320 [Cyanothece sp. SIO1E1]|nr:hypothetical protein [Cyanothece sp. SIO1E1]